MTQLVKSSLSLIFQFKGLILHHPMVRYCNGSIKYVPQAARNNALTMIESTKSSEVSFSFLKHSNYIYDQLNVLVSKCFIIASVLMENNYLLPSDLCDRIFALEFQIDSGRISEDLLTRTVQLYVQAIAFYTSLNAQLSLEPNFDASGLAKRNHYYQQKIKRLLVRGDVQECLVGKKNNQNGLYLQKELEKAHLQVPQQAKVLLDHYNSHIKQQQNLIESSLARQRTDLAERIERRSKSKRKQPKKVGQLDPPFSKLTHLQVKLQF